MKKALAVVVVLACSTAAWAIDTPFPNGSFDSGGTGFGAAITNWTATFSGTQDPSFGTTTQSSGVFTSLGKFLPQNGTQFAFLSNLGGSGNITLQSNGLGSNFAMGNNSHLQFRYAYITNDPAAAATHDRFFVKIDFYSSAGALVASGSTGNILVAQSGTVNDSGSSFSPFNTSTGSTFSNGVGSGAAAFNLVDIDMTPFLSFGTFSRVSFIVDSNGPAAGVGGNGLGVSGVVLDNVLVNPEPGSLALFALGALGFGGFAWRRRAAKKPVAA